jgi:hypothetical protein
VVGVVRFHFLSKTESVAQVALVLLTIRLDKTQSITLMHGIGNRVREPMDPLHHQAKYHHRSCMGMETMDLLHHHIQIYQICIHQDHNMCGQVPAAPVCSFALWISIYLSFLFSR